MTDQTKVEFDHATYLHPDDGHTLDCTRLHDGWMCAPTCPKHPVALARAVHRLRFPGHPDCEPNPVEVRNARLHLEALGLSTLPGKEHTP